MNQYESTLLGLMISYTMFCIRRTLRDWTVMDKSERTVVKVRAFVTSLFIISLLSTVSVVSTRDHPVQLQRSLLHASYRFDGLEQ